MHAYIHTYICTYICTYIITYIQVKEDPEKKALLDKLSRVAQRLSVRNICACM